MTLTKTQIFHRTESLSGEIKAAREAQSECRRALAFQERLTTIAAQAVERADARVLELEAERTDLAEQARAAILQVGDPPQDSRPLSEVVADLREIAKTGDWGPNALQELDEIRHGDPPPLAENGPDDRVECIVVEDASDFWNPGTVEGADFQAQAMENGLSRITDAFNRSTQ